MDVGDIKVPKFVEKLFHVKTINSLAVVSVFIVFFSIVGEVLFSSIFGEESKHYAVFEIVFLLFLAIVGELLVKFFRLPSAMVLMLLGILVSDSFLSLIYSYLNEIGVVHFISSVFGVEISKPILFKDEKVLEVMAILGSIFLLFKVGLHSSVRDITAKVNWPPAFFGVIFSFAIGYFYAYFEGGSISYAMFLAASLVATSVGITVAVLKEMKVLRERFAKVIIGSAVIDDVLGLVVLSLVLAFVKGSIELTPLFISLLSFFVGSFIVGKWFVENYIDRKAFSDRRFLASLSLALLYAYIAESIGLSAIIGAFLAGLVLSSSRHKEEIEKRTDVLELLFVPAFFISLGLLVDVNAFFEFLIPITVITILAMFSKVLGGFLGGKISGLSSLESALVGIGMSPRGEVALIVAAIGISEGVLSSAEYTIISSVALITTLIVPPLMVPLIRRLRGIAKGRAS